MTQDKAREFGDESRVSPSLNWARSGAASGIQPESLGFRRCQWSWVGRARAHLPFAGQLRCAPPKMTPLLTHSSTRFRLWSSQG